MIKLREYQDLRKTDYYLNFLNYNTFTTILQGNPCENTGGLPPEPFPIRHGAICPDGLRIRMDAPRAVRAFLRLENVG